MNELHFSPMIAMHLQLEILILIFVGIVIYDFGHVGMETNWEIVFV